MLFSQKKALFQGNFAPACEYCLFANHSQKDAQKYHCKKRGMVNASFHCKLYEYNPLMRIPKRRAPMPTFSPEDFQL